jgi:hypothetical protein
MLIFLVELYVLLFAALACAVGFTSYSDTLPTTEKSFTNYCILTAITFAILSVLAWMFIGVYVLAGQIVSQHLVWLAT